MTKYCFMLITTSLLAFVSAAHGGQITNLQVYDGGGAPTATINYSGADGTGSYSAYVYADPQVSYGTSVPLFYCVDLWHDNYIGSTYTINPVSTMSFANSTFSDVDNRIGWLLSQDQSTAEARAAVQLAIWYTVDNKAGTSSSGFTMSTGNSTITSDYNQLIEFGGYDPGNTYDAQFWQATHDAGNSLYQDLASAPGIDFHSGAVPEPASLVMGASGLVFVAAAVLRQRFKRRKLVRD
jgi:Thioester domain/PEP-CTERM motif